MCKETPTAGIEGLGTGRLGQTMGRGGQERMCRVDKMDTEEELELGWERGVESVEKVMVLDWGQSKMVVRPKSHLARRP